MKQIEAVTIWSNGENKNANFLNSIIVQDNLESSCSFYYQLCEGVKETEDDNLVAGSVLSQGNLNLSGEEYLAWDGSNEEAYLYIASKLNLTIL